MLSGAPCWVAYFVWLLGRRRDGCDDFAILHELLLRRVIASLAGPMKKRSTNHAEPFLVDARSLLSTKRKHKPTKQTATNKNQHLTKKERKV